MLPLHHGVYGFAILDWRFSIQAQCPKFSVIAFVEQLAGKIEVELSMVKRMILLRLMGMGYGEENLA